MPWWQIRKRNTDLERELQSDLELEEEEQRDRGLLPDEARYAALRAFGNPTLIREQTREAWGVVQFDAFGRTFAMVCGNSGVLAVSRLLRFSFLPS